MQYSKMIISKQVYQPSNHGEPVDVIPSGDSFISKESPEKQQAEGKKKEVRVKNKTFEERAQYFKEKYKKNNEIIAMQSLIAERKECTFNPDVQSKVKENRSYEQFWKDQQEFLKAKKQRIEIIGIRESIKEDKNIQAIPKINKRYKATDPSKVRKSLEDRRPKTRQTNIRLNEEVNKQHQNGKEATDPEPDFNYREPLIKLERKEFNSETKEQQIIDTKPFRTESLQYNENKKLDFKELIELLDKEFNINEQPPKVERSYNVHERLFYNAEKPNNKTKSEVKFKRSNSKNDLHVKNKLSKEVTEAFYRHNPYKDNIESVDILGNI